MFKASSLYLTVPKPCQQDWNDMTPDETGRFCSSCNKTVIDFTNLTDEEVFAVFQKSTTKICGRLRASQLNRELYQQKRNQNALLPAVMISSVLVTSFTIVSAQAENIITLPVAARAATDLSAVSQPATAQSDTLPTITGKVFDTNSVGIYGATVIVKGTSYRTVSDTNGNFRLDIQNSLPPQDIILEFASLGFCQRELKLSQVHNLRAGILMKLEFAVSGEMEMIVVRKPSLWQRVKRIFK